MTKKAKILFILLLVLLVLALFLIFTSESVKTSDRPSLPVKNASTVLSDESYKSKVKQIFNAYEKLVSDNNLTIENITQLKNEMLGIKGFQAKFQKLHLSFVLALDKMKNYLTNKDGQEKNASQQIASQLKADYSWLNN